jgi:hypothetical protein
MTEQEKSDLAEVGGMVGGCVVGMAAGSAIAGALTVATGGLAAPLAYVIVPACAGIGLRQGEKNPGGQVIPFISAIAKIFGGS